MQLTKTRSGMREVLASKSDGRPLIGRIWTGRTKAELANEYLEYLYENGVLSVESKPGCLGMQLFRRIEGDVAEFTTISYWRSMEDMRHMHAGGEGGGDVRRVAHLEKDPDYLLELPKFTEITELHANDWLIET